MKLYVARHGQTNYNVKRLANADPSIDVHLTPDGVEQVSALAQKLKPAAFERIFISKLKRTKQTATAINEFHHVPVEADPRLGDNRTGFEGRPYPEYFAALDATPDRWTARLNDGESLEDVKLRVADFLNELRTKPYQSVLIVTSKVIILAIRGILEDLPNEKLWRQQVDTASCIELDLPK